MYKYSKILNKILNIQKYNRKKETLKFCHYTASTHLNSKQSINIIQQDVPDLSGYYPVLLNVHVFTCWYIHVPSAMDMYISYVYIKTCDISDSGLSAQLIHLCNMNIICI